jgi:hypothetical protein
MSKTRWVWLVLALLYGSFFSWYTSFKGPLSQEEIDHYMALASARGEGQEPLAHLRRFMEEDTGDDFIMLNAIELYETPRVIEGVTPGQTSQQVLDQYMDYMVPALFAHASHPIFFGFAANSAMDLMNADGMEKWTQGAAMRYRSRRDMLEISLNSDFRAAHKFKVAAIAKTIAYPLDPWGQLGDPRLVLLLLLGLIGSTISWFWATRSSR